MQNKLIHILISITLLAIFIFLVSVIKIPILAEMQYDMAQKLVAKYRWSTAETNFKKAINIDRFNSRYFAGFGEFLIREGSYDDRKKPFFERARALYERALALNPSSAEYAAKLGEIQLCLFLEDEGSDPGLVREAFHNFKRAVRNDPNGFNVSYMTGYASISVWKFLKEEERGFILDRLKYSIKTNPYYARYIYPKLWEKTKDLSLLKRITPETPRANDEQYFFLKKAKRIEEVKKEGEATASNAISAREWRGQPTSGKSIYENGEMYWDGAIYAAIRVPEGALVLKIQAKGSPADGTYPYMIVEIDGDKVGETFVYSTEWKEYIFKIWPDAGVKALSITFTNDGINQTKGEDRNLFVGEAKVEKASK